MVNLKKYNPILGYFVLILTIFSLQSCAEKKLHVNKIAGKQIPITEKVSENSNIDAYIAPFRKRIDEDLNTVLAYADETIDKKGVWQTKIGNLQSDVTLAAANKVFQLREKQNVDICLLNNGGIRAIINKGAITTRTAFELMPFENSLIVAGLKGEQIKELVDYLIKEKKPHPLAGITFTIDKNNVAQNILIQKKPLDVQKIYFVATNDYLFNGGDNMEFFKKSIKMYDLDYKLRNVWIDYFKEVENVSVVTDVRIIQEN